MSGLRLGRTVLLWSLWAFCLAAGAALDAAGQSPKLQGFASADAAATAFTEALRRNDDKAVAAMLGDDWRSFVPGEREDEDRQRAQYLEAWDKNHKVEIAGDTARIEAGATGWTMPIPIVKDGDQWRFDVVAGRKEIEARTLGHNELTVVQTLLAIVDAQRDYAALDPMHYGVPAYARRLLSSPGSKDGLFWETKPGEAPSPLGSLVAKAQVGSGRDDVHAGYRFRLLYGQGDAAPGGAHDYLVRGRMIGGFAVIAWPDRYGETGAMTFIVSHSGDVYERDLGPDTTARAAEILLFNPDKDWHKADMEP